MVSPAVAMSHALVTARLNAIDNAALLEEATEDQDLARSVIDALAELAADRTTLAADALCKGAPASGAGVTRARSLNALLVAEKLAAIRSEPTP